MDKQKTDLSPKAAIVTGASSGIGSAIAKMLLELGYEVYGIGRKFDNEYTHPQFHALECDLLDTAQLERRITDIRKNNIVHVLVNNAGVGYYGLHEELNPSKIRELVRTNLEVPMILTNLLLRDLKVSGGFVINISSVTALQENPHGCAYGATKAGLTGFSRSLFAETRKYGVKVITVQPDMTRTNLYRNADFANDETAEAVLEPEEVAEAVRYAVTAREGMVVSEITLKPQIHRIQRRGPKHH
ncbi:MAG: SDR family oxidoreductase [Lachnospiraceae bacterium]|nr:SDR family oxidoreductase [Lachnospiraceae bacterium]